MKQELPRYLPLASIGEGHLSFEATDRTREEVKAATQLYVSDQLPLPLQKMGAGTRSLAILAMLLLIAKKRGRGIIAIEEGYTDIVLHGQCTISNHGIDSSENKCGGHTASEGQL